MAKAPKLVPVAQSRIVHGKGKDKDTGAPLEVIIEAGKIVKDLDDETMETLIKAGAIKLVAPLGAAEDVE
jgi:acetylglutamate kinase